MTRRKRLRFQNRVLFLVLSAVAPAFGATVVLLYSSGATPALRWTVTTDAPWRYVLGDLPP